MTNFLVGPIVYFDITSCEMSFQNCFLRNAAHQEARYRKSDQKLCIQHQSTTNKYHGKLFPNRARGGCGYHSKRPFYSSFKYRLTPEVALVLSKERPSRDVCSHLSELPITHKTCNFSFENATVPCLSPIYTDISQI
jgi:hypothetical protein